MGPERPIEGAVSAKRKRTEGVELHTKVPVQREAREESSGTVEVMRPKHLVEGAGSARRMQINRIDPPHQGSRLRGWLAARAWADFLERGGSRQGGEERKRGPQGINQEEPPKPQQVSNSIRWAKPRCSASEGTGARGSQTWADLLGGSGSRQEKRRKKRRPVGYQASGDTAAQAGLQLHQMGQALLRGRKRPWRQRIAP